MFWRKRQERKEIFSFETQDRRRSFRVDPLPENPITIEFRGRSVLVKDISAVGIAFYNDAFKVGQSQVVAIGLPGEDTTVRVMTEILDICEHNVCHCRFVDISRDDSNAIHRYVLGVQKQMLRVKKAAIQKERGRLGERTFELD